MCDEQCRDTNLFLNCSNFFPHSHTQSHIQIGHWLVQKQHTRLNHKRSRNRHTLLLSSGQFLNSPMLKFLQTGQFHIIVTFLFDFLFRVFPNLHSIRNVVPHRHIRKQGIVLKYNSHVSLLRLQHRNVLLPDTHLSFRRLYKSGQNAQKRCLSTSGRSKQREKFPFFYRQIHILQNRILFFIIRM